MTFGFVLRGDMGWPMAGVYFVVQLVAAAGGSLLARVLFGVEGNLAATVPQPGQFWQAVVFEAVGERAETQRSLHPLGRRRLRHVMGDHGWTLRGRLHESGPKLRARPRSRRSDNVVGVRYRTRSGDNSCGDCRTHAPRPCLGA
jgi:hypothetical protein